MCVGVLGVEEAGGRPGPKVLTMREPVGLPVTYAVTAPGRRVSGSGDAAVNADTTRDMHVSRMISTSKDPPGRGHAASTTDILLCVGSDARTTRVALAQVLSPPPGE